MNSLDSSLANIKSKGALPNCALTSVFSMTYNATTLQTKKVERNQKGAQ